MVSVPDSLHLLGQICPNAGMFGPPGPAPGPMMQGGETEVEEAASSEERQVHLGGGRPGRHTVDAGRWRTNEVSDTLNAARRHVMTTVNCCTRCFWKTPCFSSKKRTVYLMLYIFFSCKVCRGVLLLVFSACFCFGRVRQNRPCLPLSWN